MTKSPPTPTDDSWFPERQRERFLSRLFNLGDGWMDVRAIRPGLGNRQRFVKAGDLGAVEAFVKDFGDRYDLYVGVAARRTSGNGKLKNCGTVRAIWVDVDFKDTDEDAAREARSDFMHPVDMEVRSGNGLHCYWILDPVDLQVDAKDFKTRLRETARALRGDVKSAEPAHVLRLPGTKHFKYCLPREVALERL